MKDKINKTLKKFSFVTAQPDSDWFKVFTMLLALLVLSLVWNVYFFFVVSHDITSASNSVAAPTNQVGASAEDEMKAVIQQYDDRASVNGAVIRSAPSEVADPS